MIGGVQIDSDKGSLGHSDADVLLHAIADAILGALSEGDLGLHFPDNDPNWRDANSLQLLSRVVWLAHERGKQIGNVDANVMLETPKIRPYIHAMREKIAEVLSVDLSCVSVKAKTGEGLGAVGEGNAIEAQAIVLLTSN